MTELLERPAPAPLTPLTTADFACPPYDHGRRCWWHPGLAAWVCPPPGDTP